MMAALTRPRTQRDLCELLAAPVTDASAQAVALTGLEDDSRRVAAGNVFFARRGSIVDGAAFARDALARGAVLVVSESDLPADVPSLRVADVDVALRTAADAWYGRPQDALDLLAITGTKGKSTVAWLAAAALRACGVKPAVLGTIAHDLGEGESVGSGNTTPGALELRRLLARARDAGCAAAVLEVSSHALDQGRTEGLTFRCAVFTNLASDHMDYHVTPEAYFAAKSRLFESLGPTATAVLNLEDPTWSQLAALCRGAVITYGTSRECDVRADRIEYALTGTKFRLALAEDGRRDVSTPLIGRHNVMNMLAALGGCAGLGHDPIRAADGAAGVDFIPGRLQRVAATSDIDAFVDYAHTEDSLRQVLTFLREVAAVPVLCVVGCGGERDTQKRPRMARVAAELSEGAVFTSDNPRSEDPSAILDDMLAGLTAAQRTAVVVLPDRRAAIEHAVLNAPPGAVVLVAGKGHETYQIRGTEKLPFDDAAEVGRALEIRAARPSGGGEPWGASQA